MTAAQLFRYYAPAGLPLAGSELLAMCVSGFESADAQENLRLKLQSLSGIAAWPVSSGRAAMVIILRAMKAACADQSRDEVMVPAYTCYSVPAAIRIAGLRPRVCDIDVNTLQMDLTRLDQHDFSRTLAIVSSNLYGIPNSLATIETFARRHGIYMLDDAAQALGADVNGRLAGTFGDAGLFSFDKGKIITTIQGGAILSGNPALTDAVAHEYQRLAAPGSHESTLLVMKTLAYSLFLRPRLYGHIRRLPFLQLGRTPFEKSFPITGLGAPQASLACKLLERLQSIVRSRQLIASLLDTSLRGLSGIYVVPLAPGTTGAYARFPLLMPDRAKRDAAIKVLDHAGIGASASYPNALADVPEVREMLPHEDLDVPMSRAVAERLLTLPTHAFCPPGLPSRIRAILVDSGLCT